MPTPTPAQLAGPDQTSVAVRTIVVMAAATPSPTPNPDAMKFTLDTRLPASINFANAAAAAAHPFAAEVFEVEGVAAIFGSRSAARVDGAPNRRRNRSRMRLLSGSRLSK